MEEDHKQQEREVEVRQQGLDQQLLSTLQLLLWDHLVPFLSHHHQLLLNLLSLHLPQKEAQQQLE